MITEPKNRVLLKLKEILYPNKKMSISFSALASQLAIEEEQLDIYLNELEMDRYINQYIIRKSDSFIIEIL